MFRNTGNAMRGALVAGAAALLLGACAKGTPEVQSGPVASALPAGVAASDFSATAPDSPQYAVQPRDVLSINVRGEPGLSLAQVRVGEDGSFMAPGVGLVYASGRTPAQIAGTIEDVLRRTYLRDPSVAVNVLETGPRMITVEGAVTQPGMFPITPETTLLGAVAMGRGPSEYAKLDQVVIFREVDGQPMAARFDLSQIRSGQMVDPIVLPGDKVVIGESGSAKTFQRILEALPVLYVFNAI
ncbi:polysaccharide biosynthesis/export family protein [Paraurantiacibacter namhicola]|uniref:Polysaccharide biosynthesis/export protein n=1 Tax=Paraurantiacibacter namhicola TaxID=645517 RepID=A0A1C7D741_9SPHN|nr:polysaccharide biosynthesis/export family protein [Paraurantiacibacter namhicola]ANU07141.1 Polysaccharide biosynthesis/export protein [Paraurantiacibacter namhicola]